jgi:hypothetical protein
MNKIEINHAEYQEKMKTKTVLELLFIIRDASEAARIMIDGEKNGYYLDEVNYASMELNRRRNS